ncbi:MAG: ABC transporter ATP-binding protein [Firmicutes bacterium HGW-Firmicutes-15]|nr:MAG: ABC transporter ATP-binding protein [Firmicutes bacterium HGW-Firmicutes-15]
MAFILSNIHKRFGDLYVLKELSMSLEEHQLICILGPSGCGKTTLLNIISGVFPPDQGEISGFEDKSISYLFQETRLLRWKTVEENIDFVLKDRLSKSQRTEIIARYVDMVGLRDFKNYYPDKLSGGMKQRAAIARAFAYPADILLMDEPFKGLDLQLKTALMQAFISLWLMDKRSAFFVTHDIDEALLLGEKIYVLTERPGVVKGIISIDIPHKERNLHNENILRIEQEIYKLITNSGRE